MNSFFDYCGFTRSKAQVLKTRAKSPVPDSLYSAITCSNFACVNETKDPCQWKQAKYNRSSMCFCSEDCYLTWLEHPGLMGSWSPDISAASSPDCPPNIQSNL